MCVCVCVCVCVCMCVCVCVCVLVVVFLYFFKQNSIKSRCVIGLETILFAGVSVHLSARKYYRLGQ